MDHTFRRERRSPDGSRLLQHTSIIIASGRRARVAAHTSTTRRLRIG